MNLIPYLLIAVLLVAVALVVLAVVPVSVPWRRPHPMVIYNAFIIGGVLLIGFGVGLWHSAAAGMVVTGALMLMLTLYVIERSKGAR